MQSMSREEKLEIEIVDYSSAISDIQECINPRQIMVAETEQTTRIASDHVALRLPIPNADHEEVASSSETTMVVVDNINNIPDDIKLKKKLFELVLVISFTAIVDLWKPFGKNDSAPYSYLIFMMSLMVSFYFAANGILLVHKYPGSNLVRACILIALLTLIVALTLLISTFLPSYLKWLPWILFVFTVGVGVLVFLGGDVNSVYDRLRRQRHY
ncbi:hypothetical protein CCACVL1_14639 [Corchorus capsularis]|uniref:Uncharacterized protein n=1 Tax=Corchorus capsularis TaxID=210143 RepID=A0A1R3I6E4_COCAP|nr:hypothetical protein CCACVL1_14639 [Corchorus capsularis]